MKLRTYTDPKALLPFLSDIIELADTEKEALGFIPKAAYRDSILQRRIIGMIGVTGDQKVIVGYLLYGGTYPHARVAQIAVDRKFRQQGIASSLINSLISLLEIQGFLTVKASVASDLTTANLFYERCGFLTQREKPGGKSRKRTIQIRVRILDSPDLLSGEKRSQSRSDLAAPIRLQPRIRGASLLYVIDVNVLLDLARGRGTPKHKKAISRIFSAALEHQIKIAIAQEFSLELERQNLPGSDDPILILAKQLPRLPHADREELEEVAREALSILNKVRPDAPATQQGSDAQHLAHAALSQAAAYITSDQGLLVARQEIFQKLGVDVSTPEEFVSLLSPAATSVAATQIDRTGIQTKRLSITEWQSYVESLELSKELKALLANSATIAIGAIEGDEIIGVLIHGAPANPSTPHQAYIHCRQDHINCAFIVDHLFDQLHRISTNTGAARIELSSPVGQHLVKRAAKEHGFSETSPNTLSKLSLGYPLTNRNWQYVSQLARRSFGVHLQEKFPTAQMARDGILFTLADGETTRVNAEIIEAAFSPTLLVWPGRHGVILPIAQSFTEDLFDGLAQYSLLPKREAAFLRRRVYYNSPRSVSAMRPGTLVFFYESKRTGGSGAIISMGRLREAVITDKTMITAELVKQGAVPNPEEIVKSSDVLVSSFDCVIPLPSPVSLRNLRHIGAEGRVNFQTATPVQYDKVLKIIELGWARAG